MKNQAFSVTGEYVEKLKSTEQNSNPRKKYSSLFTIYSKICSKELEKDIFKADIRIW